MVRLPLAEKIPISFASFQNTTDAVSSVYVKAATLGVVAGMRSMLPLALLNWTKVREQQQSSDTMGTLEQIFNSPGVQFLASSAAVGEVLGDKLPIVPGRTQQGPFIGRVVIGALAGMTLCRRYQQSPLVGAALGAAGAGAGTLLGYYSRIALAQSTGTSDTIWGLAEDVLALSLGLFAVRNSKR